MICRLSSNARSAAVGPDVEQHVTWCAGGVVHGAGERPKRVQPGGSGRTRRPDPVPVGRPEADDAGQRGRSLPEPDGPHQRVDVGGDVAHPLGGAGPVVHTHHEKDRDPPERVQHCLRLGLLDGLAH